MAVGGVRVIRDGRIQEVQADCAAAVELSEEGEHVEMGWRREGGMGFEGGRWNAAAGGEARFCAGAITHGFARR